MRRLAWGCFSFAFMILICKYITGINLPVLLVCAFILGVIMFFALREKRELSFWIAIPMMLAVLWNYSYDSLFLKGIDEIAGKEMYVTAESTDYSVITDYGSKCNVKVKTPDRGKVKVTLYSFDDALYDVSPGDELSFTGEFKKSEDVYEDSADYFHSEGNFVFGYPKGEVVIIKAENVPLKYFPKVIKANIEDAILSAFPENAKGLSLAMITGERDLLDDDVKFTSNLKNVGIYHITAVSGMHVSFLAAMIIAFTGKKKSGYIISIPIIFAFMAMVGFSPSVTRAGVMQIIMLLGLILTKEPDPITSIGTALFILLTINPYSIKSVGLQLSFASTLGIIIFSGRIFAGINEKLKINKRFEKRTVKKLVSFVLSSFSVSFGAMIFTVPLTGMYFGYVSIIAPITNLLTLFAANIIFSLGFIISGVGLISIKAAGILGHLLYLPIMYIRGVSSLISKLSFASLYTDNILIVFWIVYVYLMIAAFLLFKGKLRQVILPAGFAVISLCLILIGSYFYETSGGFEVTALPVGQGQSVIMTSGKYTVMADCGSSSGEKAGDIAVSHLKSHFRDKIDILMLTHFHEDHANGVKEVLSSCDVISMIVPVPDNDDEYAKEIITFAESVGTDIIYITENASVSLGNMDISIYPPSDKTHENERCLGIVCTENDFDVIITGDMPSTSEKELVYSENLPDTEVVIIGHHGSKHSACEVYLDTITPEKAIISVGENSYGHPTEETLFRLSERGIETYRTDIHGKITIEAGN